jgi:archaellum component FlaC
LKESDIMMGERSRAGKMLVPVLGVLAALAMCVAAAAIVLQMKERDKRLAKERELLLVMAERDDVKGQLEDIQKSKTRIEDELARSRTELSAIQEKFSKAASEREALAKSVDDRQKEIDRISKDLTQAQAERKEFAAQLEELSSERDAMQQQLADLEQAKSDLESKVLQLSDKPTVELDKIVVTNDPLAAAGSALPAGVIAAGPMNGQVVVINREYDFIVMNLGKKQGLAIGQEFQVVRGDEVLGRVKVEKIYDELSAAAILPDSRKDTIREGDQVKAL